MIAGAAPAATKRVAITDWSERAAICASAACLVHCLALPLLVAALPALSAALSIPESFHAWVLGLAIPCAGVALGQGWRRHHAKGPLLAGVAGLGLLAAGALAPGETPWEVPVTVAGSLALAIAHIVNWRLRRTCGG